MAVDFVEAAGGVVCKVNGQGKTKVLLVHRPAYDDWTFPKGKLEPGESAEDCAVREVEEEAGLRCELKKELSGTTYIDRRGRPKSVRYWEMNAVSGQFKPNKEVDEVRWLSLGDASTLLSYPHDLWLLDELGTAELAGGSTLLIRHASAGNRGDFDGDDRRRPLDARGRLQALELAETLATLPIRKGLSSPYKRCVETVAPLAERLGVKVESSSSLAEGARLDQVEALVSGLQGGDLTALCTHGDIVESVVGADRPGKKASVWVLKEAQDGLTPVRYMPPPQL